MCQLSAWSLWNIANKIQLHGSWFSGSTWKKDKVCQISISSHLRTFIEAKRKMNSIFPLFFLNILIVQAFTDGKRYKRGVYDLIPQDRLGMIKVLTARVVDFGTFWKSMHKDFWDIVQRYVNKKIAWLPKMSDDWILKKSSLAKIWVLLV